MMMKTLEACFRVIEQIQKVTTYQPAGFVVACVLGLDAQHVDQKLCGPLVDYVYSMMDHIMLTIDSILSTISRHGIEPVHVNTRALQATAYLASPVPSPLPSVY